MNRVTPETPLAEIVALHPAKPVQNAFLSERERYENATVP